MAFESRYAAVYVDGSHTVPGFKITDVESVPTSRMCNAPIETGYMYNDNKVIDPMTLVVKGIVNAEDYSRAFSTIKKMYLNRDFEFYKVYSRAGYFDNLCLLEMPHKEDSEKYDAIEITLKFLQVMMVDAMGKPESESNSDTKTIGLVVGG